MAGHHKSILSVKPLRSPGRSLPHTVNLSFPGLDAHAVLIALKDLIAVSTGSACTSHRQVPSHVLQALGLDEEIIAGAIRMSWSHMTPEVDWA